MILTTKNLQYKDILDYISEETIARYYLGVNVNTNFNSFFRDDPNPSARLYYYKGRIWYNDFVVSMTLSDLIMKINNWSYTEFLAHLKADFLSTPITTRKVKKLVKTSSNDTILNVKYRDWEQHDLDYWGQGGITKEWLEFANIFPISHYFLYNRTNIAHKWAYTYDCYWHREIYRRKVYQPLTEDKSKKWISNIDKTVVTGWETVPKQGGDLIITASSYKDAGVIQCNLTEPNSRKMLPSFAPNTESSFLSEIIIPKIKSRFKRWIVWFDTDLAGRRNAERYRQVYGCEPIFIPEKFKVKDPFEYRNVYGKKDFYKLSKYLMYGT